MRVMSLLAAMEGARYEGHLGNTAGKLALNATPRLGACGVAEQCGGASFDSPLPTCLSPVFWAIA